MIHRLHNARIETLPHNAIRTPTELPTTRGKTKEAPASASADRACAVRIGTNTRHKKRLVANPNQEAKTYFQGPRILGKWEPPPRGCKEQEPSDYPESVSRTPSNPQRSFRHQPKPPFG